MEAILIKTEDEQGVMYSLSGDNLPENYVLSKQNCDEIFLQLYDTEIEVEIETKKTPVKMPGIMVFTKAPKLDSEGCLILKRI
jgi:hypothetical protein